MKEQIADYIDKGLDLEYCASPTGRKLTAQRWTDQILTLICQEIEKGLLTNGELDAADKKICIDDFLDATSGEAWFIDRRNIAQAQLQKILSLMRGEDAHE